MPSPFAKSPSLSPVRWGIPDAVLVWIIGFFAALAGLLLMIAVASTTGKVPAEVWEEQILKRTAQLRPKPEPTLLDLHFSLPSIR